MITVSFQSETEFSEEIALDADSIDRRIVRLTYFQEHSKVGLSRLFYLVGSYSIQGQIVMLRRYYGELTGDDEKDADVMQAAALAHTSISAQCQRHDLAVRPGMLKHIQDET